LTNCPNTLSMPNKTLSTPLNRAGQSARPGLSVLDGDVRPERPESARSRVGK
jgi:hypothetical protein